MEETTRNATMRRGLLIEKIIYRRNNIHATTYKRDYIERGLQRGGTTCRGIIMGKSTFRENLYRL